MKFVVAPEIFAKLPEMYVGVVVAQGINNAVAYDAIITMLKKIMSRLRLNIETLTYVNGQKSFHTGRPFGH